MTRTAALIRRLARDRAGASAAEFALSLPLLLVLTYTFLEAGRYIDHVHVVTKAVREGARFAGRQDFASLGCGAGGLNPAIASTIKHIVRTGSPTGTRRRLSYWTSDATVSVSVTCEAWDTGIYETLDGGAPVVEVSADVPYSTIVGPVSEMLDLSVRASAQSGGMRL